MRGKVVAELVSDERVVALFAGRRLLRIGWECMLFCGIGIAS